MAELVDALDLGSSDESRGGSSPSARTRSRHGIISRKFDMQITQTVSEDLRRQYTVTGLPASWTPKSPSGWKK